MTTLGWLVCACDEVPGGDAWLSPHERERLAGMRFAKRRDDFRVGRWAAKCAVRALTGTASDLHDIDTRAAADGAPEVFFPGGAAPYSISIAHSGGRALAVVGPSGVPFGADLETIEPRSPTFIEDYFIDYEQRWIACHPEGSGNGGVRQASEQRSTAGTTSSHSLLARAAAATLLWSVKESVLKALRAGLREDTRAVETLPGSTPLLAQPSPAWRPIGALVRSRGVVFEGFAMEREGQWLTILAQGAAPELIALST